MYNQITNSERLHYVFHDSEHNVLGFSWYKTKLVRVEFFREEPGLIPVGWTTISETPTPHPHSLPLTNLSNSIQGKFLSIISKQSLEFYKSENLELFK